ncbi:hypothetical protein AVEN_226071-1, partial [Araneus ventricosus]
MDSGHEWTLELNLTDITVEIRYLLKEVVK